MDSITPQPSASGQLATIATPYGPLPCVTLASLDTFTRAYLECALWSSHDNSGEQGGEPLDRDYGIEDFTPQALAIAVNQCTEFQRDNAADLALVADLCDAIRSGHNFWLNRNGHGSGFWDEVSGGHDLRPVFDRLSDYSKHAGTCDVYLGDPDADGERLVHLT